jgi:inner membrane protein COX18
MREVGHLGPSVAQNTLMKKVRKKRKEVYKRWGVQMWKTTLLPLLQLPVFLVVIEAIRKMCGEKQGLFGMFTNTVSGWFRAGEVDTTLPASLDAVEKIPIEASFATEGMLWFPNLLLPDPNLGLPFILSGVILINIFSKGPIVAGATDGRNRWQKRFQRSMGVFALAIGPLTFNIPSAMLIYWISSSTFAYGQSVLLDKFMPIKKPVHACKPKRPLTFGVGVPQEGEKL